MINFSFLISNNLYGYAMSCYLPTGGFEWILPDTHPLIWKALEDPDTYIQSLSNESDLGFMLEIDLEIPIELHGKFNDFPPAVTKRCVSESEVSESYQKPLMADLGANPNMFKC